MLPAMPEAIEYLTKTLPHFDGNKSAIVSQLLDALSLPIVRTSAHMQTLILALFVQIPGAVAFPKVAAIYKDVEPSAQREILLLAGKLNRSAWLQSQIATIISGADPWLLRALVEASSCLSGPERKQLGANVKSRLGSAWLLEDPTRHDRSVIVPDHLAPKVLTDAGKQDVMLSFSESPDAARMAEIHDRYGGRMASADEDGLRFVFRGLDTRKLLADVEGGRLDSGSAVSLITEVILADTQCLFERLPDVTFSTPAENDADTAELRNVLSDVDILLVTTADIEKRAVLSMMAPLPARSAIVVGSLDNVTYRVGRFGRYAAAHVHTTQGSDGRSGATLAVQNALSSTRFKACLVIGIAFGFDRKTQRLGDVLVAEQIQPYEHAKIQGSDEHFQPRGNAMQCGKILADRFRNRMDDWFRFRTETEVEIQQGTVLAGAKLVNSLPFRDRLYERFKDLKPIGGEMEGHGAYAAAQNNSTEIVLVKAICDWADGDKNDLAQQFAAEMATDACHHLLSKPGILDALNAKDLGPLPPPPP